MKSGLEANITTPVLKSFLTCSPILCHQLDPLPSIPMMIWHPPGLYDGQDTANQPDRMTLLNRRPESSLGLCATVAVYDTPQDKPACRRPPLVSLHVDARLSQHTRTHLRLTFCRVTPRTTQHNQ